MSRKAISPYLEIREPVKTFSCYHKNQMGTVPGKFCFRAAPCRPHPTDPTLQTPPYRPHPVDPALQGPPYRPHPTDPALQIPSYRPRPADPGLLRALLSWSHYQVSCCQKILCQARLEGTLQYVVLFKGPTKAQQLSFWKSGM